MADKPRWSVDGERLYFIVMQGGFFNVWAVPFDPVRGHVAGPAYQVTHFDSQDHMLSTDTGWQEPAVSRRFLYLLMTERTGSIWRLDGVGRIEPDANRLGGTGRTQPNQAQPGRT